jgi:hypothetical protein
MIRRYIISTSNSSWIVVVGPFFRLIQQIAAISLNEWNQQILNLQSIKYCCYSRNVLAVKDVLF